MTQTLLLNQCVGFLKTLPLWQNEQFGIQQFKFPDIDLDTFSPKAIPSKIRLGHQMEYMFKQLIEHSHDYEVLLHNLPIKNENRTIGEIDFILRDKKTGELIHIELTYKFYIINPEITEPVHRLIGPNKRDMFFTKMEKIKNEQFALIHSKEAAKSLLDKNIDAQNITHQVCYKTQLFEPLGSNRINIRPLNKSCVVGYWLRFEDLKSKEFIRFEFFIPIKSQWVVEPHEYVQWKTHFEILMDVNLQMLKENAPMVWMRKTETKFEKFFVVWW